MLQVARDIVGTPPLPVVAKVNEVFLALVQGAADGFGMTPAFGMTLLLLPPAA